MVTNLSELKARMRANKTKLKESFDNKASNVDDRFWKPGGRDDMGEAVIRFLPNPDIDECQLPYASYTEFFFQGPTGQWYSNRSVEDIGEYDPVRELNRADWNKGTAEAKARVRNRKARKCHVCNILVVNDPWSPDNNGKVFLYKYGPRIHKMIESVLNDDDEDGFNPFDMDDGAYFRLIVTKEAQYKDYKDSKFRIPKPIPDEEQEAIFEKLHPLAEFTAPENYKPKEVLAEELRRVMGTETPLSGNVREFARDEKSGFSIEEELDDEIPSFDDKHAFPSFATEQTTNKPAQKPDDTFGFGGADEIDPEDFFNSLGN